MNLKRVVVGMAAIVAASTIAVTSASAAWATGAGPGVKGSCYQFQTWAYGPNNTTRVDKVEIHGGVCDGPGHNPAHFELYGMYPGVGYGWLQDFRTNADTDTYTYSFGPKGYNFDNGTQLCSRWWWYDDGEGREHVSDPSCVSVHN